MRTRAGIVLIENERVALIERHRAGLEYYVFPGGGVDPGETPVQAAIREAMEELGVQVTVGRKLAEVYFDQSHQVYFLAERTGGVFGTGTGEEFTEADPNDPHEGIYLPVWIPIAELPQHPKVYPADLAQLVWRASTQGWPEGPIIVDERAR